VAEMYQETNRKKMQGRRECCGGRGYVLLGVGGSLDGRETRKDKFIAER